MVRGERGVLKVWRLTFNEEFPFSALFVARSRRLLQRQRSLHWNSASFASFAWDKETIQSHLYSVNPALRSWLCSRSAIQTSLIALAYSQSSLLVKNTLHPSVRGAGRKILLSSRLGPRVESAVNMNEQAHDNMSASHGRCENGKRYGYCTFFLACKERINALNISD